MKKKLLFRLGLLACLSIVLVVSFANSAIAKSPITLDFVSFLNPNAFEWRLWKPLFMDKVNERAKGELVIRYRGGPEVMGIFDQPVAVQKGTVDMSNSATGFLSTLVPGMDCMRLSELTAQEERQGGANDYIREVYGKAGFYYLGRVFPSNIPAFWVFTNKKAMKKEDFAGMKIAGSPSFHGFFKALGAAPTNVGGLKDYYTGMERGVLDAHTGSIGVFIAIGSYEVTKYVIDHPYYMNASSILMNLKKWNSIPKHLQRIMMDTAIELETTWKPVQEEEEAKLRKMAEKKGVQFYKLPPDVAEWYLNEAYEGGWESDAKKYPPDIVANFKKLLQK